MESVFYGFENENFMKTKEEILKEATKRTLNINEGSPLHEAVMKAMEEYAQQQVKNCVIPAVSNNEVFYRYGKPFTSGRDLWDFLTAHYNFIPKT